MKSMSYSFISIYIELNKQFWLCVFSVDFFFFRIHHNSEGWKSKCQNYQFCRQAAKHIDKQPLHGAMFMSILQACNVAIVLQLESGNQQNLGMSGALKEGENGRNSFDEALYKPFGQAHLWGWKKLSNSCLVPQMCHEIWD